MNRAARFHLASSTQVPLRILTVVPICDGHDSAIITINIELVRNGIEVIYLGYHRSARDIVRAAIQEDVRAIGISSYNGGHIEFFSEVLALLRHEGAGHIGVFGGGGGTITRADAKIMKRRGVDEIFFAGTSLLHMVKFVKQTYGGGLNHTFRMGNRSSDLKIVRQLWAARNRRNGSPGSRRKPGEPSSSTRVVGITGPGGAGKTTLIDELTLRFLKARAGRRLAILSHDPSSGPGGAMLGDRATMVYAQDDRVFMRSLATRGRPGGLAAETRVSLAILKSNGFDLILVESTGIGQEDRPFPRGLVDRQVLVMSPDYGSRLQLQKIAMLETADIVVSNKSDLPAAPTAIAEIQHRLGFNERGQQLISTVAKRHADPGVDALFDAIFE